MKKDLKTKELERIHKILQSTTDKLGMPIDKGIFNTVKYLNALGYKTSMSCEGHLKKSGKSPKGGLPFPWVVIDYANDNADLRKMTASERNLYKKNQLKKCFPVMNGILGLIDEFYKNRHHVPSIHKITVVPFHQGNLRIQSLSGYFIEAQPKKVQSEWFFITSMEMRHFTKFLKIKYFSE